MSKHLDFYYKCLEEGKMPESGLCLCENYIDHDLLFNVFKPYQAPYLSYWAAGYKNSDDYEYQFTPLRQNIVLLMACLNGEL
jgi:hypothetical protein